MKYDFSVNQSNESTGIDLFGRISRNNETCPQSHIGNTKSRLQKQNSYGILPGNVGGGKWKSCRIEQRNKTIIVTAAWLLIMFWQTYGFLMRIRHLAHYRLWQPLLWFLDRDFHLMWQLTGVKYVSAKVTHCSLIATSLLTDFYFLYRFKLLYSRVRQSKWLAMDYNWPRPVTANKVLDQGTVDHRLVCFAIYHEVD